MHTRSSFLVAGGITLFIIALIFVSFTVEWGGNGKQEVAKKTIVQEKEVSPMQTQPSSTAPAGHPMGFIPEERTITRETSIYQETRPAIDPTIDYYAVGVERFRSGEYEEAAEHLQIAVDQGKEGFHPLYLLGLAYRFSDQPGEAARVLDQAAAMKPNFGKVWVNLTRALLETGEIEAAAEAAEKGVEVAGDFTDAWNVLGRVRLAQGHIEFAEDAFLKAVQVDSSNVYAQNNLGYARILLDRFEEAVEPLRRAVALEADVSYMQNNLGIALERTGDLEGAREAFAKAVEIDGGQGKADVSLVRVEERIEALAKLATPADTTEVAAETEKAQEGQATEMAKAEDEGSTPPKSAAENR